MRQIKFWKLRFKFAHFRWKFGKQSHFEQAFCSMDDLQQYHRIPAPKCDCFPNFQWKCAPKMKIPKFPKRHVQFSTWCYWLNSPQTQSLQLNIDTQVHRGTRQHSVMVERQLTAWLWQVPRIVCEEMTNLTRLNCGIWLIWQGLTEELEWFESFQKFDRA